MNLREQLARAATICILVALTVYAVRMVCR